MNREEYNVTFKTNLTKEQFKEIMGKPVSDISDIEELALTDKKGNAWYFLPKEKAIPIAWMKNYYKLKLMPKTVVWIEAIEIMLTDWEKENETN